MNQQSILGVLAGFVTGAAVGEWAPPLLLLGVILVCVLVVVVLFARTLFRR